MSPCHCIQRAAIPEPLNLRLIVCMRQLRLPRLAALGVHPERKGLADRELGAHNIQLVVRVDLVIVGGVSEGKGEHALFLKVGFVLGVKSVI